MKIIPHKCSSCNIIDVIARNLAPGLDSDMQASCFENSYPKEEIFAHKGKFFQILTCGFNLFGKFFFHTD